MSLRGTKQSLSRTYKKKMYITKEADHLIGFFCLRISWILLASAEIASFLAMTNGYSLIHQSRSEISWRICGDRICKGLPRGMIPLSAFQPAPLKIRSSAFFYGNYAYPAFCLKWLHTSPEVA